MPRKVKNKSAKDTETFAAEKFAPLIEWVSANKGGEVHPYRRIAGHFYETTGEHIDVNDIRRWLHPNMKERRQCRYGAGVVLVERVLPALRAEGAFGKVK